VVLTVMTFVDEDDNNDYRNIIILPSFFRSFIMIYFFC